MNMKDLFHDAIVSVLSHIYQPIQLDVGKGDSSKIEYSFRLSGQTADAIAEDLEEYLTQYLPGKIYTYNVIMPIASMLYNPVEPDDYTFSSFNRVYFDFKSEHLDLTISLGLLFQNQGNGKWYHDYHYNRRTSVLDLDEYELTRNVHDRISKRKQWPLVVLQIIEELDEIFRSNGFSLYVASKYTHAHSEVNPPMIYLSPGLRMPGDNIHVTLHSYLLFYF
ncbi:MAG: hypothetical protein QXM12_07115 [Nitrososphaerota archaeon]